MRHAIPLIFSDLRLVFAPDGMAWLLRERRRVHCRVPERQAEIQKGGKMVSDLISYAPLAVVFVVAGLRMMVEKPNKETAWVLLLRKKATGENK